MEIIIDELTISTETFIIFPFTSYENGIKYLKTKYANNKPRFIQRFFDPVVAYMYAAKDEDLAHSFYTFYNTLWDNMTEFTYEEAFKLNSQEASLVFSVINISEMISNLGSKRIETEGIELKNKVFNPVTNEFETFDLTQIYELYEVDGLDIGINEPLYVVKCWCTSTNEEHWLWIEDKMSPLKAISSTCIIYKSMLGKIKHIIRQGDVFLFEMTEDIIPNEEEDLITLSEDIYFNLLKSQS